MSGEIKELNNAIQRITHSVVVHTPKYSKYDGYDGENDIFTMDIAKALHAEGYRKQSEGKWIYVHTYLRGRCSICGHQMQYDNQPYCANCGAKMKGADNE